MPMDIATFVRTLTIECTYPDFCNEYLVNRICLKLDDASIQTQNQG